MYGAVEVELMTGRVVDAVRFSSRREHKRWLDAVPASGCVRTEKSSVTVVRMLRLRAEGKAWLPVLPEELARLRKRALVVRGGPSPFTGPPLQ